MGNLINKIFLTGLIGAGSLGIFGNNGYGQTEVDFQNINSSSEYREIDRWIQELYKKDSVEFKEKCYDFLNKKIDETLGEILYYKSIEKPDLAEVEHLKDNEKLVIELKRYSCNLFEPKKN